MLEVLENFLRAMRPAFSRQATSAWFVIVFVGFLLRSDTFGVSSIVRALSLVPESYTGRRSHQGPQGRQEDARRHHPPSGLGHVRQTVVLSRTPLGLHVRPIPCKPETPWTPLRSSSMFYSSYGGYSN